MIVNTFPITQVPQCNIAGSKGENVADTMTGVREHAVKSFAQYGGQYIFKMYENSWKVNLENSLSFEILLFFLFQGLLQTSIYCRLNPGRYIYTYNRISESISRVREHSLQ